MPLWARLRTAVCEGVAERIRGGALGGSTRWLQGLRARVTRVSPRRSVCRPSTREFCAFVPW
eukprot:11199422-Lingulodinium_polyedra.AAC.1